MTRDLRASLTDVRDRTLWTLFGDRVGLAIFLLALAFFALTWETHFRINDNYTLANTMGALSEGHLHIDRAHYTSPGAPTQGGTTLVSPGTRVHAGRLYGEQYGQLFLALPVLLVLRALGTVADLRIAIVGVWCLLVLALSVQVGTLLDRRRAATLVGSAVALVLFGVNVWLAADLDAYWMAFISLHVGTMVAGAFVGVLVYRLVSEMHDRTARGVAGVVVVLATPVGLWSAIPMRHATTTALVLAAVYWFYRSRAAGSAAAATRFRALSYVPVGLIAWVFAPEGLFLLAALGPVDLLTARSNATRELLVVGVVLFLSLVPFFVTNLLIGGNPISPPVLLDQFTGQQPVQLASFPGGPPGNGSTTGNVSVGGGTGLPSGGNGSVGDVDGVLGADNGTTGGSNGTGGSPVESDGGGTTDPFTTAVSSLPSLVLLFASKLADTAGIFVTEPERVFQTFVRMGYVERGPAGGSDAINLAVLESMPLAGALAAVPVAAVLALRRGFDRSSRTRESTATARGSVFVVRKWLSTPERATDLLVVTYVGVLVLSYMPSLPLHAQFTVRYLTPAMALAVYGLFRLEAVRKALSIASEAFVWTYTGGILVGGQLVVVYLSTLDATTGELVQFHALLGLALAVPLGTWVTLASTDLLDPDPRGGSVLVGLAAAATTVFVLLGGSQYYGGAEDLVIPISRVIATGIGLS